MKSFTVNLLITVVASLFILVIAEAITRAMLPAPQIVVTQVKEKNGPPINTPANNKKYISINEHPNEGGVYRGSSTGLRLQPNRTITIDHHRLSNKKVLIETNSLGYRNPEIGKKNGTRILFLGDSVTFQDFLNEEETFVRIIEANAKQDGLAWETINAGVGAISLKTELAILLESGLSLSPDMVVINFYLNDFQESKGVQIIRLPWLLQKSYFFYYVMEWINQFKGSHLQESELNLKQWREMFKKSRPFSKGFFNESPEAFNQMILDSFQDYGAIWGEGTWQHIKPLFSELKQLSEQHHFKLVIVAFPVYQQVYTEFLDDTPQTYLKKIGTELNIPILDTLPSLRAEALRLRGPSIYHTTEIYHDLFYDQCHHTPEGSLLIANDIYHFLQQQLGKQ